MATKSRFFGKVSDSEESEASSPEAGNPLANQAGAGKKQHVRWEDISSSDSEEEVRVVKSHKDKRLDELNEVIRQVKTHSRNSDFNQLFSDYENLGKIQQKSKSLFENSTPIAFIRAWILLEQAVNEVTNEQKKRFNQTNLKSFNKLKNQLKKQRENYEQELNDFTQNPQWSEEEKFEDDDESQEEKQASDEDESSEWGSGGSDSESDDDEKPDFASISDPMERRKFWVIKPEKLRKQQEEEAKRKEKEEKRKEQKDKRGQKQAKQKDVDSNLQGQKKVDFTHDYIQYRIKEIQEARGHAKTDPRQSALEIAEMVQENASIQDDYRLELLLLLIATAFDTCKGPVLAQDLWKLAKLKIQEVLHIKENNPTFIIQEEITQDTWSNHDQKIYVGNISSFVEVLVDENIKFFQEATYSSEYESRLHDLQSLYPLMDNVVKYYQDKSDQEKSSKVRVLKLSLLYYLNADLNAQLKSQTTQNFPDNLDTEVQSLTRYVYEHGKDMDKVQCMLYHSYYLSFNGKFSESALILSLVPYQSLVTHGTVLMQVLYNRCIAMLGLAAFENGQFQECYDLLNDLICSNKLKDLLGQNQQKENMTKDEVKRSVPLHLNMSSDLLECVYLVSAVLVDMLEEFLLHPRDLEKHIRSKLLKKEYVKLQNTYLPPTTFREFVVQAGITVLTKCDWEKSAEKMIAAFEKSPELEESSFRRLLWNNEKFSKIQQCVTNYLKQQTLKVYLIKNQGKYTGFNLGQLSEQFVTEQSQVLRILSKMIVNKSISGHLSADNNELILDSDAEGETNY